MKNYSFGSIILVSFPSSNTFSHKVRPALIISNNYLDKYNDVIILGITSKSINDPILEEKICNEDLKTGSLPKDSFIRVSKISSLEKSLIIKKVAELKQEKMKIIIKKIHAIILL